MGFSFFGTFIPYYGTCILIGIVCAYILGYIIVKKLKYDSDDFLIIFAYLISFGFLGAKILFILVSFKSIDFHVVFSSLKNFNLFISSGFVFYGGLIGGVFSLFFIKWFHKIETEKYARILPACLAAAHGFGRIGCSLAGCCYGKQWDGPVYFVYTDSIIAQNGVKLFPVQGIEAGCLFILAFIFTVIEIKYPQRKSYLIYMVCYAVIRFLLEFFRGDVERGLFFGISTSQLISVMVILGVLIYLVMTKNKKRLT